MKNFFNRLMVIIAMVCVPFALMAVNYQLPDPQFEDWSGTPFSGSEQPKYWNFSNVSQMGVDKNFAHKTTGRSGVALKIQDQFVGVMGIGATSPGYVALGTPWAYVSSLTTIEDATAGTYGGISWTTRPDTMVVWIKRYYDSSVENAAGDHSEDENFNLIFYAWSGTSYAPSFKAKNLSCTDISASHKNDYCVDEESDIRQALNGNECGTQTFAKQICEGWYYEKKAYANWTQIKVPIYYFNDDVPEKCNVILSAGNYPNFRANSGQNAGMSMDVDDISLIYSAKIHKLYVNGKEWKGFDPNTTEVQTYTLGLGATEMPTLRAVRGAGSLTNNRGQKATFPGRQLSDSECTIQTGTVDGDPTVITVKAEDGLSTMTYRIKFVSTASSNARLAEITVNGQAIEGFNAYLYNYDVALPYGTTAVPVVEAAPQDGTATVNITQATSTTGKATIVVTAGDGTQLTYTVQFSVAALNDATLQNIFVDGSPVPGFLPSKSNYSISLPLGTTAAPTITWESAYPDGVQTIELLNNTLADGAQIKVSVPGGTATKTYKLTYKIEASTYSYLAGIQLDGEPLEGFTPEQLAYTINLPLGTTSIPAVTWTKGDNYQTVTLVEGGVDGVTRIEVKAASGATSTYRLTFRTAKSGNTALAGIAVGGTPLEDFQADKLEYNITLPAGTVTLPEVTYTKGDEFQTVNVSVNQTAMTVRLVVTAGDGSTRLYIITFDVQKSENAFLKMIYLDGAQLAGFVSTNLNYSLTWTKATSPKVTVDAEAGQSITISKPALYGVIRIVVTPEEGTSNTYTIRLNSPDDAVMPAFPTDSFPAWEEARLAGLFIGGEEYTAFKADTYDYTYPLAWRTYEVPAVVPVAATLGQTITVEHGAVNRPTVIRVQAADKKTTKEYTILFTVPVSSNTALASVEIDGINFEFDPTQKTYNDIVLPYGTKTSPTLTVERGEPEQSLVITEAPLGEPSTIVVTAEDGSKATYTFTYKVAFPDKTNTLQAIVIDGIGALNMSDGPDFNIDLPLGATDFDIVSMTKNYPEQEIYVLKGGVLQPTVITVKSINPAEADKVYTITPHVPAYDPAILTDIKINDISLPEFRPEIFNYVLSVETTPEVTYTAQEGADVTVDSNAKWVKLTVVAGESEEYNHTYLVTFYYPNDVTFDLGFNNWQTAHNDDTNSDGQVPTGWHAPIDAITSGDAATYHPEDATQPISGDKTEGANSAELATEYLLTSAESMPGFLSLSQPTVTVGKWLLWVYEIHSTLAFGDPISFRNTPDNVQLDYKLKDYNKVEGWRFIYNSNGMKQVNFSEKFSTVPAGQWRTVSRDITYDADYVPMTLDILISAANSDNLEDYFISSDGLYDKNKFTSHMNVDNLRLNYSSVLNNVAVNGVEFVPDGVNIAATVDADFYGVPSIVFSHAVQDQMPVINWSDETNGVRTATIRNYAEDLSYTDYVLTVTRSKSSNKNITYSIAPNTKDLTVVKGSPYQTITVTKGETAYTITVKAEDGTTKDYTATWEAETPQEPVVTPVPAEDPIIGTSTAKLVGLIEEPVVNYSREYVLDSVVMVTTDTCYYIYVYGASATETYTINRHASKNALLASMELNDKDVPDFYGQNFDYDVTLPSLEAIDPTAQEEGAEVRYTTVKMDDNNVAVFVQVTAPDGVTTARYAVRVRLHALGTCADLTDITADEVSLSDFHTNKYEYTIELPSGSAIPQLSAVACDDAVVESAIAVQTDKTVVTFTVTSEDGKTTHVYTVNIRLLPSDVCTFDMIYINDTELPGFQPTQTSYSYELPYGTQGLPEIDYVLTDPKSTATKSVSGMTVIYTVTAEDGGHTTVYTITFTVAKSDNADLKAIYLDGKELASFYADEYNYSVELPYGSSIPVITATAADPNAKVQIEGTTITVTAENGVATHTYTVTFTIANSTNALLLSIDLDGVQQPGFESEIFEYENIVDYDDPLPVVTWVTADEQQQVDTVWTNDVLTITVTAGDGVTTNEYVLTFEHLLSPNWHLADLQINGVTIEGFDRDKLEYTLVYPIGTNPSELVGKEDIIAIPEEANATVTITQQGDDIQIFVTAPNGVAMGVYTITQDILLSDEARLKMIWTDSVEIRNYSMDSLTYTIILIPGAIMPEVTAETLDPLATWELGLQEETEYGKYVEVYGIAQDGTVLTYKLRFEYANWQASSNVKPSEYLFYYYGDNQYKAVSIAIGAQIGIYDFAGRCLLIQEIPTAHPADVEVYVHPDLPNNKRLLYAIPSAAGVYFRAVPGEAYFYVFFDSKTKRVERGGKFELGL